MSAALKLCCMFYIVRFLAFVVVAVLSHVHGHLHSSGWTGPGGPLLRLLLYTKKFKRKENDTDRGVSEQRKSKAEHNA